MTKDAPISKNIKIVATSLLLLLALFGLVGSNYWFANQNPGGNDFIPLYIGTRMFVANSWSPYSSQTGDEIQQMVYGRAAKEGEDHHSYVYPFYAAIIFLPFSLVSDYTFARALWLTFLEILIIILAFVSMKQTRWKPSFWLVPIYLVFSLLWYHSVRPIINGNAVVIVAVLIGLALAAIQLEKDTIAGFLLGYSTIKPNLVLIPILFVVIWAISHKRWKLIGWTFGSVLFFILIGMIFIPDWPLQNIAAILRYPEYTNELTLGAALEGWWPHIGPQLRWGMTIFLAALLAFEWRAALGKGSDRFLWTICLTLTLSQWLGIATDPGNFIILFPAIVVNFAFITEKWKKTGDWIVLINIVILFIGLWFLFLITLEYGDQPTQNPVMYIPLPLFLLIGLYGIRLTRNSLQHKNI